LQRIEGVTLFDKVLRSEIRKSLNIDPLLLQIERPQLRWFGHASFPKQALLAKEKGKGQWDEREHAEKITLRILDGLQPSEMLEMVVNREVWRINLQRFLKDRTKILVRKKHKKTVLIVI